MLKKEYVIHQLPPAHRAQLTNFRSECSRFRKQRGKTKHFQNNKKEKKQQTEKYFIRKAVAGQLEGNHLFHILK